MTGQQMQKLVQLQPRIKRIAHAIRNTHYKSIEVDDLVQEMNLHIIEKTHADPSFILSPDKYITNNAAWAARDWCRNQHRDRYTGYDDKFETVGETSDLSLSVDVAAALNTLDRATRRVASLLAHGIKGSALCSLTGLSKQQLTIRRKKIRVALSGVVMAA